MAKINDIKYLKQVQRLSYRKIKSLTGHSYATIKKYEETENFNQTLKKIIRKTKKTEYLKLSHFRGTAQVNFGKLTFK